jgi:hypothetical protein
MATVTASYNWVSGETVTPTKLNSTAAPTVVVADNEVTTSKILDANVTNAKLASGIDASKLTTGTLPIARIADGAVSAAKLAAKVTFPNYGAISTITYSSGTVYQAASDGYLMVHVTGSFMNGIAVYVGATSSPNSMVWRSGDDINSNTKAASSGLIPIPKDIYYKIENGAVAGNIIGGTVYEYETVEVYWIPVIS